MNPIFSHPKYSLQKQVLALQGKLRFFDPGGNLALYVEQKMFRLKEDIRVYPDEMKSQEVLLINARQIIDWDAAYDVTDGLTGEKVGTLRRKGWRSMLRDEWELLDANEQPVGVLIEDSEGYALLRRFLLGALLPQRYDILINGQQAADLTQRFTIFGYEMQIDFSMDINHVFDHRLGLAGAVLLALIERKQNSD